MVQHQEYSRLLSVVTWSPGVIRLQVQERTYVTVDEFRHKSDKCVKNSKFNIARLINKKEEQSPTNKLSPVDREKVHQWVKDLPYPNKRENALLELSKKCEIFPDLAPMLWRSFGIVSALLDEITNIYPALNPPTLTDHQSNRVCNVLALLQCVASHPKTYLPILSVNIHEMLYPFLHTVSKTRPFKNLRRATLEVIAAPIKIMTDVDKMVARNSSLKIVYKKQTDHSEESKTIYHKL